VLTTSAQAGNFTYNRADGAGTATINLFALAASQSTPQTSTIDPTIQKLLADIRTATASDANAAFSSLANNVEAWNYSPSATQKRKFPTVRVDYNLTNAHRIGFSYRYNDFNSKPDMLNSAETRFPGFPNEPARYPAASCGRSTSGRRSARAW